ncbi:MAG: alpha/beta fold hydrolase [Synechococcaceae cyanobacterium SM2_3_60]|nr:alpha/beta fold hydrolase [Synechococcaceae cyanobacterium SM2_3_60]
MTVAQATQGHTWTWQGQSIYYVQAGKPQVGRPALLCVHGFGASTDHWRHNIADWQADFQVFAIDLLGFGRSAKPKQEYAGTVWQQQLRDFMTEVVQGPAILLGNSLGGYASLCAATQSPLIQGVVLLNSAGPFLEPPQPGPVQKVLSAALPLLSPLIFYYTRQKSVIRKTLQKVYVNQAAVTPELIDSIQRPAFDPGAKDVFAAVFKAPRGERLDQLLAKLDIPLLLLWGKGDPWMNVTERSRAFQAHYQNLTEHFLEAGHCPHDDDPATVNRLVREWVDTVVTP